MKKMNVITGLFVDTVITYVNSIVRIVENCVS